MTELQYAARGRSVVPGAPIGGVPPHILGMTSSVRGSIRRVHVAGAAAAIANISTVLGPRLAGAGSTNPGTRATATAAQNYIDCVQQYVTWDAASGLSFRQWQLGGLVTYSAADSVEALVRVVVADANDKIVGRIVLWDTETVTGATAEVIAAVAVELLDATFGAAAVTAVDVWQLRHGVQYRIPAAAARSARPRAAALVASI